MKCRISIAVLMAAFPAMAADEFSLDDAPAPKPSPIAYTDHFEVGAGYQSLKSYYVARYGGIADKGGFAVVDGLIDRRDAWETGGTRFWGASAQVLGFDRMNFEAHIGNQGLWRGSVFYDSFTRFYTADAKTPFDGAGTNQLTLPGTWQRAASSLQFTALQSNLKPLDLSVHWQKVGSDLVLKPWRGYEARLQVTESLRKGTKDQSIAFGEDSNSAVAVFIPQPVDYETTRLVASFGFASAKLQWKAEYTLAVFRDSDTALVVPTPFSRAVVQPPTGGGGPGGGIPIGGGQGAIGGGTAIDTTNASVIAQYSLPPSSLRHAFQLTGGYAVSPATRLTARASYAIESQDEPFLPYTGNTSLTVGAALPRASLRGRVEKTQLAVTLTSRPTSRTDINASYSFDDRNNRTPRDLFNFVENDSQNQANPAVAGNNVRIRYNLPHSFTFHHALAEAGYRPWEGIRLSLTYTGDFRRYDYQQVSRLDEQSVRAKAAATLEQGSIWSAYSYSWRDGSVYDDTLPWDSAHVAAFLAGAQNQSIENPLLRKYNLADRRRHEAKGGATYTAFERLTFNASAGLSAAQYPKSALGLGSTESFLLDGDVSFAEGSFSASVFYSLERMIAAQRGYTRSGRTLTNAALFWAAKDDETVHTAGLKMDWEIVARKLKAGVQYTLSHGTTEIGALASPLPDTRALTHNLSLKTEYAVRENMTLRGGYTLARQATTDWAYLGGYTPLGALLGSGMTQPRFTNHIFSLAVRYSL